MRKFVFYSIFLLLMLWAAYYAVYERGFYIDFNPDAPIEMPFCVEGKQLMGKNSDGVYEPLLLRGVDVSASLPGHYSSQFAPEEKDYLRWFEQIADMGANAVRASLIMDDHFYNALYAHNISGKAPLYLLQGISVFDYSNNNANDAYGEGFFDKLVKDGLSLVDIVHGRKTITLNETGGSGYYRRNLSEWVIGYLVGSAWVSDTVAYTNHNTLRPTSYQGKYFYTDSTAFEAMLAQVMEQITQYENDKYKTQRPIGFINSPASDFLEYEEIYARQLLKCVQIDAENITPTELMKAGTFAAYSLYDFCEDFTNYLSVQQKDDITELDTNSLYGGYTKLLYKHHSMPIIAAGYGFSSSRGIVSDYPLNEREQGERIAAMSDELEADGFAGGFVSSWQDSWEQRTWNTAYSSAPGRNHLWHDLQTDGQSYGLMAFEP